MGNVVVIGTQWGDEGKGKIIDTGVVINLDEYQLLVCSQEHQEKMMIWLQKYIISDDVKLNKINGKYTILELLGPQADSFMTIISGNIVNISAPSNGNWFAVIVRQ